MHITLHCYKIAQNLIVGSPSMLFNLFLHLSVSGSHQDVHTDLKCGLSLRQ